MKKEDQDLTFQDIQNKFPQIPFFQIEYWIKCGKIQVKSYGRGVPRKFPPDTIKVIRKILSERS